MATKRMRVFAGPNGSGKTTIINSLQAKIAYGVYVNADDIEIILKKNGSLFFNTYRLIIDEAQVQSFFKQSNFAPVKRKEPNLWQKLSVKENILFIDTTVNSYLAADLAEFIRQQLLANDISFTYETVMSHKGKIDFLQTARDRGYRVYLYFIATEDPSINISRVKVRVAQYGHDVAPDIIENRYYKSLQHLKAAIKKSNRAFLWDNSGTACLLIAEITEGNDVKIVDNDKLPNWFIKYLAVDD